MKVTYLTIEDIRSGLFKTQVLELLTEMVHQCDDLQVDLLVINRPWLWRSHLEKKKAMEASLKTKAIRIKYIPLLPPLRYAVGSRWYSSLVTRLLTLVSWMFVSRKSQLIHCRSYWPTKAILNSFKKPVIFDMRSLWPAENISMGNLIEGSPAHKYWARLEERCLQLSAASTCVSAAMQDYVRPIAVGKIVALLPISVSPQLFCFNSRMREFYRKQIRWTEQVVIVYSGSFGMSSVNVAAMRKLFRVLLASRADTRLLFLTGESDETVYELMDGIADISKESYKVIHPEMHELGGWLSVGDIGVHALPMQLDAATRLGTKVVEYWMNGLPVIVNEHVGAAAALIREYKTGQVVMEDQINDLVHVSQLVENTLSFSRDEMSRFAIQHFSVAQIAEQYLDIYTTISQA